MAMVVDAISWLLFAGGALLVFLGGVGVLRMPDFYTRMHAASMTDSLGTLSVLLACMLQVGWSLAAFKLLVVLMLLLVTGPTASYALANAARLARLPTTTATPPMQEEDA